MDIDLDGPPPSRRQRRNRAAAAIGAGALAAVFGIVAAGTPASAVTGCASGVACAWETSYFGGNVYTFVSSQRGVCHNFSSTMNDKTSSMKNSSGHTMVYYKDAGCAGASYSLPNTWTIGDLAGTGYNDTFSSGRMNSN